MSNATQVANGNQVQEKPIASTAIARVVHEPTAIEPVSFAELRALAKDAADSRFFGAESPAQALLIMMAGRDLGFSYTQSLRSFHVIKGKPSLSADGMVAACLSHKDVCEYFRPVEVSDTSATFATKRVGDPERRFTFSMEDAKRAELTGNPTWKKFPSRMLSARAKSSLAREVYPDLLAGLYEPDEVEHFERRAAPPSTPAVVVEIDTSEIAAALEQTIRDARSESTLRAAGASIKKAFDEGKINASDRTALAKVYEEARAALKAKKAAPPPDDAERAAIQDAEFSEAAADAEAK